MLGKVAKNVGMQIYFGVVLPTLLGDSMTTCACFDFYTMLLVPLVLLHARQ